MEEAGCVDADKEQKELFKQLEGMFTDQVIRKVSQLHTHLEHPSPHRLADELLDMRMTPEHVPCARLFFVHIAGSVDVHSIVFSPASFQQPQHFKHTIATD